MQIEEKESSLISGQSDFKAEVKDECGLQEDGIKTEVGSAAETPDWLIDETQILKILHQKLRGKFKSERPLSQNLDETTSTEQQVDDLYSSIYWSTISLIGEGKSEAFLSQMQRVYDKQLLFRSELKSEGTEVTDGSVRRRRKAKAERKTLKIKNVWSEDEIEKLLIALKEHGSRWTKVAASLGSRSHLSVRLQVKQMIKKAEDDPSLPDASILNNLQ